MSQLSAEDEAELQSLLKQLLRSINDRISGAPSTECAEEILLHLEETDKNFHNYEFVKYLRQYVESSLGTVVEEETNYLTRGDGQHAIGSGHDTLIHAITRKSRDSAEYQQMMQTLKNTMIMVVESLINKFEEDQIEEGGDAQRAAAQPGQQPSYAFIRQEQLQVLAEQLDSSRPKEVLCGAPPSDVLICESWSSLRRNLCDALTDPDLSDNVLQFFAKSFSSSPLNVTREIYTSLAKSVESSFLSHKLSFPTGSATIDINRPEISRLLKQEVIESTFSLLSLHHEHGSGSPGTENVLEPIHLLALLDVKATWFKKWMHGYYSRTVVLRLLERKYKSLIVAALQQCIHYTESCERVTNETDPSQRSSRNPRSVYTGKELEYAFFVHSLCVLGKLLIYTNGRKLFPITVKKRKDLVVILINIVYQHLKPLQSDPSHTDSLTPSCLAMEVLWMLCERTESAAECLHQTAVIETLLAPVKLKSPAATLPLIADVLARIANTDRGLSLFLYEKNLVVSNNERTFPAHVIVQFTLMLLEKELSSLSDSDMSQTSCGAFIFVCRQMYNTCEGLQVLRPYGLHKAVAAAWKKTSSLSERVPTPVPGATAGTFSPNMLIWEETLLDSLLNFAATPKGLLLLQQTGAITECVSYMFSRFTKKLQVSRCEKFGYGVMVTQVAATAPGVAALHTSGFVRALVVELWSVLECGIEEVGVAVWELLGRQPLANKSEYTLREMPTSIPDMIDRLIAVNTDAKIHSLFHYEQSHTFGLRLLSVLCCNLDSFLLLESQYNIVSMLLQSQRENVTEQDNDGEFIIDNLSVERNHVLVRGEDPYPWPMFSSSPLPTCYTLDPPKIHHDSQDSEMSTFLASFKDSKNEASWMEDCRRQYCKMMTSKPNVLTGKAEEKTVQSAVLSSVEQLGINTCLRYGSYLKLLTEDAVSDLPLLMRNIKIFLSTQRLCSESEYLFHQSFGSLTLPPVSQQDGYPGYDWLACTIHVPVEVAESGISPMYWCTAHYVEMLLKAEVPLVHSAFRMSGFTPSQMCLHWLTQCFWNYLDWTEICHYVSTCVLMGPDYQVYMCVAVFTHLQPDILQRTHDYMELMEGLEQRYRNIVLTDMKTIRTLW
ncbi:hypothetical protein F7725_019901, partial [Dissostichus mawsoni]